MGPGHGAVPGDGGPFTGRRSRRVFMGIGATSAAGLLAAGFPTPAEASPTTGRGQLNVFNVRSFGARGDGATDDTRAIQRAIDAATSGGIIFFPPGTYPLGSSLDCDHRTALAFLGAGGRPPNTTRGSTIRFTADGPAPLWSCRSSAGLTFQQLRLVAANPSFTGDLFDFSHAPTGVASDAGDVGFDHCSFLGEQDTGSLLNFNQAILGEVRNCSFWNGNYGIVGANSYSNAFTIDNCEFSGQTTRGIFRPGEAWNIRGCTFEPLRNGEVNGMDCSQPRGAPRPAGAVALTIEGCWFGDARHGTCITASGQGLYIVGNQIYSGDVGVQCNALAGLWGCTILGNRFHTAVGIDLGAVPDDVPPGLEIQPNTGIYIAGNRFDGGGTPFVNQHNAVNWAAVKNADIGDVEVGYDGVRIEGRVDFASGISTKIVSGPPSDAPPEGTIYLDAADSRLYIRVAGTWKSTALT